MTSCAVTTKTTKFEIEFVGLQEEVPTEGSIDGACRFDLATRKAECFPLKPLVEKIVKDACDGRL